MRKKSNAEAPFEGIELEFVNALDNIKAGTPTNKQLLRKARQGTLKLNIATVAKEAARSRTLIGHDDCAYPRARRLILESMVQPTDPPTSFEEVNRNLRDRNAELETALKLAMSRAAALARKVTAVNKQAARMVAEAYRRAGLDRNGNPIPGNSAGARFANVTDIRSKLSFDERVDD